MPLQFSKKLKEEKEGPKSSWTLIDNDYLLWLSVDGEIKSFNIQSLVSNSRGL